MRHDQHPTTTVRETGSTPSWLLGDRQGSVTTTITTGTATTRWYRPYGTPRGPSPVSPVVTTGFLGKHEDPSGLTHLDHRDYDPTTGTFITIDPLVATTGEPYQYATGNPTTLSDPTGLTPCDPSEEFGCGPIMDEPSRICAVAPTWPGCGKASPQTNEVQRWVDTCQGSWTYCNNLVTQGGIYDNPAAWRAYVALMMLLRLGYLEVRGNGSTQDYLFANTSLLPEGSDNFRVVAKSGESGTGFDLVPVEFSGWTLGISSGFCIFFCLEIGISSEGFYIRPGIGFAVDSPSIVFDDDGPACGTEATVVYGSASFGPAQLAGGWSKPGRSNSWSPFGNVGTSLPDGGATPHYRAFSGGGGVIHQWTAC